ncbi:class I SAM-dependent DNA methyltransferase [Sphaerisporangium sp. NPDC005289]|uniref:Eco57I restriction-modification methylase domain-containing protein n=1 Tax=Sphaerisporangium sp. NPDC005289 TaxID=3155247 RepID=UPI0033A30A89
MAFDSLVNRGEYFSSHYLAEILAGELKRGVLARWADEEKAGCRTPRLGLRALRRPAKGERGFFDDRGFFIEYGSRPDDDDPPAEAERAERDKKLHELHIAVLGALGFLAQPREIEVVNSGRNCQVPVAYADQSVIAIECGWATTVDAAMDQAVAGRLLTPVQLDPRESIDTGADLASFLFSAEQPPKYVLVLAGGVLILADRHTWGERRYLGVSLDLAFGRGDLKPGGELDMIAALFGADTLLPAANGGAEALSALIDGSRQHAVGVSEELREGLRISVELIADEVLARLRQAGVRPEEFIDPGQLTHESLRYLYRILFLLYAEARPELKILPVDDEAYVEGYGLARLGDLVVRDLVGEAAHGFHLYESLDLLFRMVNGGHQPRKVVRADGKRSDGEGLRFEALRSELFDAGKISLIGRKGMPGSGSGIVVDTRLRNATLHEVLRRLMLRKARKKERGGFISYAQLGINQLGAVYEGLMSYTGFIANERLYEVAKGDARDGSWMVPESKVAQYADEVFVKRPHPETGVMQRVVKEPGGFVYRLAGRDRQTSASYYTPQSLTEVTVKLALKYRLDQEGMTTPARELLNWRICEPALGSGAFLNEAINQVAAEYLRRRRTEPDAPKFDDDKYPEELQKVKAYIALHNSYGVDLNNTAVELAEVSLWLNVMHSGLQAPWFGLHLRRGNSLIGAGRRVYSTPQLAKGAWLTQAPEDAPFATGALSPGKIHHFLLPALGWGAVAGENEARQLATQDTAKLAAWRKQIRQPPTGKKTGQRRSQIQRLQELAQRAEYLWRLVQQRLEISEREISRRIDVYGADDLPQPANAYDRADILRDLHLVGAPYWRLKTVMDAWCALWFWPVDKADLLDGSAEIYTRLQALTAALPTPYSSRDREQPERSVLSGFGGDNAGFPEAWEQDSLFGGGPKQLTLAAGGSKPTAKPQPKPVDHLAGVRSTIPLADLDDWLDFAEAVLGRADLEKGFAPEDIDNLDQLAEHEDQVQDEMFMDPPSRIKDRFPWLDIAEDIAQAQGFFHWEIEFAHVFKHGGFDLQIGNPPWVRPRWEEAPVLAELDPWFMLADKPPVAEWRARKEALLTAESNRAFFLGELASNVGAVEFLSSVATHALLAGTQVNLYRAFMVRAWRSLGPSGIAGLLHPDSHMVGAQEGRLRAAAYRHLRIHAHFHNRRLIFADVDWNVEYAVQIYGAEKEIGFTHVSWLYDVAALTGSFDHDGMGERPGIKFNGYWDLRPHRDRLIEVNEDVLTEWQLLTGETGVPAAETKLLYPVTSAEQGAIAALSQVECRLSAFDPQISAGYHESNAKKDGLIEWRVGAPGDWSEVIMRGPQFTVATPFAKQPPLMGRNDPVMNVATLAPNAVPTTDYQRSTDLNRYQQAQDRWLDHRKLAELRVDTELIAEIRNSLAASKKITPELVTREDLEVRLRPLATRRYTEFYRLFWRVMIPNSTERSLYAALMPSGPAHVDAVNSMALSDNRMTALAAGFWASLPLDYLLRITGRSHLRISEAKTMPALDPQHPLADALLLRTLRLNCLTEAYAELWAELHDDSWACDSWAASWPGLPSLGTVGAVWTPDSALRAERARRAALVELDALVALMLGIDAEELAALYRSRFPQLVTYESAMWFDANGRKLAENFNAYGHGQMKGHFEQLMKHLADPGTVLLPEGYSAPFYKADREGEYRQAHAAFAERLRTAWKGGAVRDGEK